MATSYFGSNLTDLQRGVSAAQEMDVRKRIAADQIAAQLAAERIRADLDAQRLAQQSAYQQGQLGVANRQADADAALAAAELLFNQNKQASDVALAQERNRLFGREIDARYPNEASRVGEQRLKNEQAEREAMRLVEEHNNAALAAATRFNAQLQSRINATKMTLEDQQKARGNEWFTLDRTAKSEFDAKRKQQEAAGWPAETQAVLDLISKDPDASKVIFDGKQFVPKQMRFTPGAAGTAIGTTTGEVPAAINQLFGGGTQTSTAPAPASSPSPAVSEVWVPGMSYNLSPAAAPAAPSLNPLFGSAGQPIVFSKPAQAIVAPPTEDNRARARARFRQLLAEGKTTAAATAIIDREFPGVY